MARVYSHNGRPVSRQYAAEVWQGDDKTFRRAEDGEPAAKARLAKAGITIEWADFLGIRRRIAMRQRQRSGQ